ncbi:site-specific DNA-methyltransferase [Chakrabartyella piscis]|uniref:site-specific DNA-methyltransferase n=1 Tax=Chakrabartyella piscis TaxID=2918914 RepID=UPI0029586CE0|nr:site-specific DNA-methyltransferase [Chakrabartyella piscis]
MTNKLNGLTLDLEQTNKDKLKSVFPECFVEGTLDIDKLLSLCGAYIDNDFEKYKFEWKGKADCLRLAQKRSSGTLRPCKEESVNFDETENLYIEGDNLEVLKLLQTAYYRKVKMIYIDPPYNTGNDFVYEDDFKDPMAKYKEVTSQTTKSNPETMGRYHTNWLNMMYPRLRLASNLLRDDGVIFISIDDNEIVNMRRVCDEVFGEENFVGQFVWKSRQIVDSRNKTAFSSDHEYILVYSKVITNFKLHGKEIDITKYSNPDNDVKGPWMSNTMLGLANAAQRPNLHYSIVDPETGLEYPCNPDTGWRFSRDTMAEKIKQGRIIFPKKLDGRPREKKYLYELEKSTTGVTSVLPETVGYTLNGTKEVSLIFNDKFFDFPKPVSLMKFFINQATDNINNDIILDFFSGSATTAHAVMRLNAEDGGNRKFIMVQLPEKTDEKSEASNEGYHNICEIGKERIRRAGKKINAEWETNAELGIRNAEGNAELNAEWGIRNAELEGNAEIIPNSELRIPNLKLDVGFKVFKLDTSNLREWDSTPIENNDITLFNQRLNDMVDSIKPDRLAMDVVYEIMLKMGVPLDVPVSYIEVNKKIVYVVGDLLLLICFAENITAEDVEAMAEYAPAKIICAEQSFADDSALSNAHYILKDKGIEMKLV